MAKIKYASFVTGLSGKSGSSVFYRSTSPAFGYLRNLVTPAYTENNADRGKEFHNLGVQYRALSAAAKTDFQEYARRYRLLPVSGNGEMAVRANNGMACFIKMMWNLKKEAGESVQLGSITLSDITTLFFATSVMACIDNGWLPSVPEYQEFSADFIE